MTATAPRLHEVVEATACRNPQAVALETADGDTLTYASLVAQAERVCRFVETKHGEIPERIGLVGAKSARSYVAYLAILRLGATVVPMNNSVPPDRLRLIADAAGLELVLTDSADGAVGELAEQDALTVLEIPELGVDAELHGPSGPRVSRGGPDRPAYVLFTSGSTGRPKGVPVSHANALSFVEYNIARYGVGPGDRMTQTFDLSFDVSVYDLFVAWGSGATLVAPGAMDMMHPARWVTERAITHWTSVPSVVSAAMGLGELAPDCMPSLRLSLFIGEQLTYEQAEAWKHAASSGAVENFYGPTELTVAVSAYRLADDITDWPRTANRTIPIGQVYEHLEAVVVADGETADEGELCVRGPQRFAGYLDRGDNAGRFLTQTGGRFETVTDAHPPAIDNWYRTGDLVRRDPSGALVHLGRLDAQVKIRGFRVELPEIEGALRLHANVLDAAVFAVPGRAGSLELAACFVGAARDARELRSELSRSLPAYMIPRRFLHMESFPLTDNGKVDRHALAEHITSLRATHTGKAI
ncbi:amino acid adenylation domain-containing protein [Streptomyces sp. NBC_00885]|uniref:amino acid adenylation domain-containing protein n=1 Tax=Streptomyces sp. NBC_00885 TaxID=2975857 RepID=UPI00386F49DC|nr:amino acid adenylation domain-containing protein [Streptomyces sp. NBC_00885]